MKSYIHLDKTIDGVKYLITMKSLYKSKDPFNQAPCIVENKSGMCIVILDLCFGYQVYTFYSHSDKVDFNELDPLPNLYFRYDNKELTHEQALEKLNELYKESRNA